MIGIMAHQGQYDFLSNIFGFSKSSIRRFDYTKREIDKAVSKCEKVFLFVGILHHFEFMSHAKIQKYEAKCVSLLDAK